MATALALIKNQPPPERFVGMVLLAPVLLLPRVFKPELCEHLIGLYETHGGTESGFMREISGRTVGVSDPNHKRRNDYIKAPPGGAVVFLRLCIRFAA